MVDALPAGDLRTKVTIQRASGSANAAGHIDLQDDANWATIATRRCRLVPKAGRESWRFKQVRAEVSHLIELRSDSVTRAITPADRLLIGSRILEVDSVFDVEDAGVVVQVFAVEAID